jgi:hypothetical protein
MILRLTNRNLRPWFRIEISWRRPLWAYLRLGRREWVWHPGADK